MQCVTLNLRGDGLGFLPGQYLEIVHPSGRRVPLSIASSPLRLPELEIHYRSTPGTQEAADMDALLAAGDALVLQGPFGAVSVDARETRPLLMIAGGTGAAQALSIIEDLTLRRTERPVTLLCCADGEPDFYFRRSLETIRERWLETVFIADPRRTPDNAAMLWLARHADAFRDHRILLCGSPAFVYAAADVLMDAGIDGEKLESDVFAYAPRP